MIDLKGKRALFIGTGFYFYDRAIVAEIERQGASVLYITEFEVTLRFKIEKAFTNSFLRKTITKREDEILGLSEETSFDFVFVVTARYLSSDFYYKLRKRQVQAKFILYLWDSVTTTRDFTNKEKYFDRILSFDRLDSIKYPHIIFRPLFYLPEYKSRNDVSCEDLENDIYFIGRLYDDRIYIIRKIKKDCKEKGLKSELILYTSLEGDLLHSLTKYFIQKEDFNILSFKRLTLSDNVKKMHNSISILDIELRYQSGLTIRTIETIGSNRKLITTNKDIINYDFYDPTRVYVIDRVEPIVPVDFIRMPMNPYEREISYKYSLTCWIKDIFI